MEFLAQETKRELNIPGEYFVTPSHIVDSFALKTMQGNWILEMTTRKHYLQDDDANKPVLRTHEAKIVAECDVQSNALYSRLLKLESKYERREKPSYSVNYDHSILIYQE